MKSKFVIFVAIIFAMFVVGCGGSGSSTPPPPPPASPINVAGPSVTGFSYGGQELDIAANLSQTGGSISAGQQNVAVYSSLGTCNATATISGTATDTDVNLTIVVDDIISGTTSTITASAHESGGQFTTTVAIPASMICGFNELAAANVNGFFGTVPPISGSFSGTVNGQTANIVIAQTGNTVTITGQVNAATVSLTGDAIGSYFDVKGTIGGSSTEWIGMGNHQSTLFVIADATGNNLGRVTKQ